MIGRLTHVNDGQNMKEKWLEAVGESETHWFTVMCYPVGPPSSLMYAVKKEDYKLVEAKPAKTKKKAEKAEKAGKVVDVVSVENLELYDDLI